MSKTVVWITCAAVAALLGLFLLWPIAAVLQEAFLDRQGHFTFAYIAEVFQNRLFLEGLANSLLIALGSTVLTTAVALPLAWLNDRFTFPGQKWFAALLLVPMILPPFVGAIGIRQLLGQYGALNAVLTHLHLLRPEQPVDWLGEGRLLGIMVLNALHLYPILFLNLSAALANIDPAMEEAAENLGCHGWRKFMRITLPLLTPGLFAGGTIVFIFAFTELGVPLIFDFSRVTSVQIFYGVKDLAGNPLPFALVAVMLFTSVALYALSRWLFGRTPGAQAGKATTSRRASLARPLPRLLCTLTFAGVVLAAMAPHVAVVCFSLARDWYHAVLPNGWTLEHYQAALGHAITVPSIVNSLRYASVATLVDVVLGLGIAWVLVRTSVPGRWLLDALAMLPLAVPGLVLAFGYLAVTQEGKLLAWLSPTREPAMLLIIAYALRRLPYVVRSAVAGLQQTSATLEEAAQSLGASPMRTLWRVTVPLISANLLAGGLLAFAFAMLEVSDSLILAQKQEHFPITKAIYELFLLPGEGRYVAAALGVWAMVFLGIALLAAQRAMGRRLGALFRL